MRATRAALMCGGSWCLCVGRTASSVTASASRGRRRAVGLNCLIDRNKHVRNNEPHIVASAHLNVIPCESASAPADVNDDRSRFASVERAGLDHFEIFVVSTAVATVAAASAQYHRGHTHRVRQVNSINVPAGNKHTRGHTHATRLLADVRTIYMRCR